MRAFASLALLAASFAKAVPLSNRQDQPLNAISCTGEEIVGNLVVRNPDGSTHIAAFVQGDADSQGRLMLTTKFKGTPSPSSSRFAAQICNSYEYIYGKRRNQQVKTGFITPHKHRNKALTVSSTVDTQTGAHQLVSDYKADQKFTEQSLSQWFTLYNNGTFYSLAFADREGGPTSAPGWSPITRRSADGQSIFVEMKTTGEFVANEGFVNRFGYALELHP